MAWFFVVLAASAQTSAPFKIGYTGNDIKNVGDQTISGRLAILLIGSNGLTLDPQGRLIITAMTDRTVVRLLKDGEVTLLGSDEGHPGEIPNGITLSPDEKYLYVTAGFGKTFRYGVLPDDAVANGKLFIPAGNDGMKVDRNANLFSSNAVARARSGSRRRRASTWRPS